MAEIETQARCNLVTSTGGSNPQPLQKIVNPVHTEQIVADTFGTNRQYVQDAKTLRDEAPDLLEQVATGEKSLPRAKREHLQRRAILTTV